MRVLIAPDKFAGTLTAFEAAEAIATGWRRGDPSAVVDQVPLSDGGPGFGSVLHAALGGRVVAVDVTGPLGSPVVAHLLLVESLDRATVYVEAAEACGIALLTPSPAAAWDSTTAGVGELLTAALDEGADRVVVGVGGTASTDGGRACVERVGSWPPDVELVVAADVRAPLLGRRGAAEVFGPQKGADPVLVDRLERRLAEWAGQAPGLAEVPGAGAGGGLAFGLLLLGGRLRSGAELVLEAVGLRERLAAVDLVITGEGRFDASTLAGKVPAAVAACAAEAGVACWLLAGDRTGAEAGAAGAGGAGVLGEEAPAGPGFAGVRTLVEAYGRAAAFGDPAARLADLAQSVAASSLPPPPS